MTSRRNNTNTITELSEVFATALAARPELLSKASDLLGFPANGGMSPGREKQLTHSERKQRARQMFNRLAMKQELKKVVQ